MRVTDPDRQTWHVSRRWVPWRRRVRVPDLPVAGILFDLDEEDRSARGSGGHPLGGDDDLVTLLLRVAGLVLVVPVVVLTLLAVAEVLLVLLALPVAVTGRVLLGRHWVVEVRAGHEPVWETDAGDWACSGRTIREVAAALERGECPWASSAQHPRGRVLRDWVLGYAALAPAVQAPRTIPDDTSGSRDADDADDAGEAGVPARPGVTRAPRPGPRRHGAPDRPPDPGTAGRGR